MVRKLIKALLAGSMMIPTLGFGLGLGEIHLRSGLNQQLDAEIELLSVEPSEAEKITASLASYDAFSKLGVDRPAVLMLMQFEVQKRPNGTPYIRIKSKELINEPFLDFLVEVSWPSGKVMREYTLLLDPPSMSAQQEPAFVEPPQVEEPTTMVAPPASLPVQEPVVSPPVDISVAPVSEAQQPSQMAAEQPSGGGAVQETAPAQEQQPAESIPAVPASEALAALETPAAPVEQTTGQFPQDAEPPLVEPAATAASGPLHYGPVKRNEILYRIAERMRPDQSISVEQMMIALYNSNRDAFIQNNINLLRKGAVLRIEDPATLRALSHAEARRQVARHGRAWEEYRAKVAASTPKSVPAEPAAESAKAGSSAATVTEEPKLSLVAPSKPDDTKKPTTTAGSSAASGEAEALHKELLLANESAEVRRKENEELNKRLKELEGQLNQMQKLLTLKDDNLAAMQQKLAEEQKAAVANDKGATELPADKAAQAASAPTAPGQPPLVAPVEAEKPAEAKPAETKPAEIAATPAPSPEAASATEPPAAVPPVEGVPPAAEGAAAAAAPQAPAEPPKPQAAPKRPKPVILAPEPEPSLVDELLGDPMMLGGGALVLILLVLGGVIVMRKRRQGRGFQESILTVGATSSMMKGKGDNPASETSFLSDLAISGVSGRVHEDVDVDPLAEADVYMAYNRFTNAEDLLKEGLKHNPERDDLHAKLLEVYYKSKNRKSFEQLAEQRYPTMQHNDGMWQKVVAMGHELAPDNPLFKGAAAAGAAALLATAASESSSSANEVFDIGLDLDALSSEMEEAGAGSSDLNVDLGLDFSDLGMDDSAKSSAAETSAQSSTLDFDLGGMSQPSTETADNASLDFDLSAFGGEATATGSVSEPVQQESSLGGLDFDLSSLGGGESPAAEAPAASLDFADFDLGSVATEEPAAEASSSFDLGSLDIGDDLTAAAGNDTLDLGNLDFGSATAEPTMDLADLGDFGDLGDLGDDASLGGMDEIGTKLDLAKAYVDMGDAEGARGMLEEVIHEGSDDQKRQAKDLLAQIA